MAKWLSGGKSTLESVQNFIKKSQEYWENNEPVFTFTIEESQTHTLVGMIEANSNFEKLEQINEGEINISYGLYPFARGKGYITKAILLLLKFLKEKDFQRAVIAVDPENIGSLKVPERVGFTKENEITTSKTRNLFFTRKIYSKAS